MNHTNNESTSSADPFPWIPWICTCFSCFVDTYKYCLFEVLWMVCGHGAFTEVQVPQLDVGGVLLITVWEFDTTRVDLNVIPVTAKRTQLKLACSLWHTLCK